MFINNHEQYILQQQTRKNQLMLWDQHGGRQLQILNLSCDSAWFLAFTMQLHQDKVNKSYQRQFNCAKMRDLLQSAGSLVLHVTAKRARARARVNMLNLLEQDQGLSSTTGCAIAFSKFCAACWGQTEQDSTSCCKKSHLFWQFCLVSCIH